MFYNPEKPEEIVAETEKGRSIQWKFAKMFARRPGADISQPWFQALRRAVEKDEKKERWGDVNSGN